MKLLVAVLTLGVVGACANYATFQEADTLSAGRSKLGLGLTGTTYKTRAADDTIDEITVPALNIWYRRGLIENLEAHASVWIPFGSSLGVKYQLTGERRTAGLSVSLGLDLGFLQISAEGSDGETATATVIDTYVPLYLGYRTGPGFALYASPKFILRTATGNGSTSVSQLAGGTAGIALGEHTTLHLEGTVMYDLDVDAPALQAGIGVAF